DAKRVRQGEHVAGADLQAVGAYAVLANGELRKRCRLQQGNLLARRARKSSVPKVLKTRWQAGERDHQVASNRRWFGLPRFGLLRLGLFRLRLFGLRLFWFGFFWFGLLGLRLFRPL